MGYMRSVIAGALAVACVSGNGDYETMFREFKATYEREYESAGEERARFEHFVANMDRAAALNRANPLARFGVNAFADRSEEEMRQMRGAPQERQRRVGNSTGAENDLESTSPKKDWRKLGAVTGVKNQGTCASGYAFAAVGSAEGSWGASGHALFSMSAQESVSCDTKSYGCQGGSPKTAIESLVNISTLYGDSAIPYVSGDGIVPACEINEWEGMMAVVLARTVVVPSDEMLMMETVDKTGPVAVSVNAKPWLNYKSGVMTMCPANNIDEGALIVGYDSTATPPYWIVKNSWSTGWGEHGYIRIVMGKNACGITHEVVYAQVQGGR